MHAAPLDYRTLFLTSGFIGAALMALLALQIRKAYPGFLRIVAGIIFLTVAIIIADLRGYVADGLWIIQISGLIAFAMIDNGVRLFCASPRRGRWPLVYIGAAMLVLTYVHLTQPVYLRIALNSLLLIPVFVDIALPFLRTPPEGLSFGYHFTAAVLIMGPIAACLRIVAVYIANERHELYFSKSLPNTLFFLLVLFLLLSLAFGFISLTHERVMGELKAAHEQLAQSERMAAVGRLAGGVAHFFNNQMCIVQLKCSLLRMHLLKIPDAPLTDIQEIENAVKRSSEITHRLVQHSQSTALRPSPFNPSTLVEEILPELRTSAGNRIEVTTFTSSDIPSVELDRGLFKETMLTLVRNARDAMPAGGKLRITLQEEKLDSASAEKLTLKEGTFVSLSVADTGVGMDEEIQRHIFEPFFTTKNLAKSEGLGLASAFGFIRQSGGTITFKSAPECGSTFELHLPANSIRTQH